MRFPATSFRRTLCRAFALLLCAALALPFGVAPAFAAPTTTTEAAEPAAGNFQAEFPKAAYLPTLEGNRRVKLLWLEDSTYTLALTKVTVGGEAWVRVILVTGDDTFVAATPLGSLDSLRGQEKLRLDLVRSRQGNSTTLAFTVLPEDRQIASLQLPMAFAGEANLTGDAAAAGARLLFTGQTATPAPAPAPAEETTPDAADAVTPRSKALRVVLAMLLLLLLAALICIALFHKQVAGWLAPLRKKAKPVWAKGKTALHDTAERLHLPERLHTLRIAAASKGHAAQLFLQQKATRPVPKKNPATSAQHIEKHIKESGENATRQLPKPPPQARAAVIASSAPANTAAVGAAIAAAAVEAAETAAELAPERIAVSSLAGVELIPAESAGSLVETVSMDGLLPAAEDAAEEPPEEMAAMNAFFLGKRQSVPPSFGFTTVGLRNREHLLGVAPGAGAPAPLFVPNPRGQVFSLSAAGNLYLHIDYFAPPSFVVHSVLSNVCLEHVFRLEDAQGRPLRAEDVRNRKILAILPAHTAKTADGYYEVIEKGSLLIGAI
ncbi:MAG: hypothetical protein LBS96_03570 [Oscillospiraceae bacterium]|jgi:hypothetical protein|nr:hypothetical protein [Oscillospiraceae bacterium]